MVQYDKKILNKLLDSYEASTLPVYFDESSLAYEEIHAAMLRCEEQGLVSVEWKKGKEGHIISKVVLRVEKLEETYEYVSRTPKADIIIQNKKLLAKMRRSYYTPVYQAFISYLENRLENDQSVKKFIPACNESKSCLHDLDECREGQYPTPWGASISMPRCLRRGY